MFAVKASFGTLVKVPWGIVCVPFFYSSNLSSVFSNLVFPISSVSTINSPETELCGLGPRASGAGREGRKAVGRD